MRSRGSGVILGVVLVAQLGGDRGGAQGPAPAAAVVGAATGRIAGRVIDGVNGRALPSATVYCAGGSARGTLFLSSADGSFVCDRLAAGSYELRVTKPGFEAGAAGQLRPRGSGLPIHVADGQRVDGTVLRLWPLAVLRGRVVDETGAAMPHVMVSALPLLDTTPLPAPPLQVLPTRTDDVGEYELSVPPGPYRLGVSVGPSGVGVSRPRVPPPGSQTGVPPAHVYASTFWPDTPDLTGAAILDVGPGEIRTGMDFRLTLREAAPLSGFVAGPSGPIADAAVMVLPLGLDEPRPDFVAGQARTSADGAFRLPWLAVGTYRVIAEWRPPAPPGIARPQGTLSAVQTIDVAPDRTPLALSLMPGASVSGELIWRGGRPPEISAARVSLAFRRETTMSGTGNSGLLTADRFEIRGVSPNTYALRVDAGHTSEQLRQRAEEGRPRWTIESIFRDGRDVTDEPLVVAGDDITGLVVTLTEQLASVTGRVSGGGTIPLEEATVVAFPETMATRDGHVGSVGRVHTARLRQDGRYSFLRVTPGTYFVAAIDERRLADQHRPGFFHTLRTVSERVTLAPDEQRTLNLVLRAP